MSHVYSKRGLKFSDLIRKAEQLEAEADRYFARGQFKKADKAKLHAQRFRNLAPVLAEDKR